MKKIQFKFYCAILCNKIKKMKQDWKLNINDAVLQFQRSTLIKVDSIYKNQFRKLFFSKYAHNWEKYCDFSHKRRV